MITIVLMGGMGNQLFQFSLGLRMRSDGHDVQYSTAHFAGDPTRIYHLADLGLEPPLVRAGAGQLVPEGNLRFKPEILELDRNRNWLLNGYWQCERYFLPVEQLIRRQIFMGMPLSDMTTYTATRILEEPNSCFLHVRRSDNASKRALAFHALLGLDHYKMMADYMRSKVPGVHFFVFSDDPGYIRANMTDPDMTVVDCNPMSGTVDENFVIHKGFVGRECEDLYLMSLCRHAIVANSTFSWWGAWLGDTHEREVLAPKAWFVVDPKLADSTDILPERWTKL